MAHYRPASVVAPWCPVLRWDELSRYRVLLVLACGHRAVRAKRRHRIYRRAQCRDCVKTTPIRPVPRPAPRVTSTVVIRPDIHARFQAILNRVDARMTAAERTLRRTQSEHAVQDDSGLNEYPVHLAYFAAGRIPARHAISFDWER